MIAASPGLPEAMREAMIAHAAEGAPREACGLVGYDGEGLPVRLYRLTNIHPDRDRFEIDPAEHFHVLRDTEARGWRIGAVYHSHPRGPARPSAVDLEAGIDTEWISFVVGRRRRGWVVVPFAIRQGSCIALAGGREAWRRAASSVSSGSSGDRSTVSTALSTNMDL